MLKKIYKFTFFLFSALSMTLSAQAEDTIHIHHPLHMALDKTNYTTEVLQQHNGFVDTLNIHASYPYNSQDYKVIWIGENAFNGSVGLTGVRIPNTVDSIAPKAFGGCTGLEGHHIHVSWPADKLSEVKVDAAAFFNVDTTKICLFCPKSAKAAYQADPNWKGFKFSCTYPLAELDAAPTAITGLVANGTAQTLINAGASYGGTMKYSLDGTNWIYDNTNLPTGIEADTYTVYYMVEGDDFHSDLIPENNTVSVTINPAPDPHFYVTAKEDPNHAGDFYSTFYHGTNQYELPNDGTEAYVATLSGDVLLLTKIAEGAEVLPNHTAVILKATSSSIALTPSDATPVTVTATNNLQGVDDPISVPTNCYVLSGHATDGSGVTGLGFYRYSGSQLNAHKAYVIISSATAPKRLPFVFDTPTDMEPITNNQLPITNKVIIDGQLIILREGAKYNAYGQKIQ